MYSLSVSALVFACVFGSALLGMYIRRVLPEEHLNPDTRIRQLQPQTEMQRELREQAIQLAIEIMRGRWIALEEAQVAMPPLFLVIVVCWLSLLFASFGLFAPANATAAVVLLIGSLSVAASVFLILELDTPFSGLMRVSDAPLRFALAQLGR